MIKDGWKEKIRKNEKDDKKIIEGTPIIEKIEESDEDLIKFIFKIAHEYAYNVLGEDYLNSINGEKIRSFLDKESMNIEKLIEEVDFILEFDGKALNKCIDEIHTHANHNTRETKKKAPKYTHPSNGDYFHRIQIECFNNSIITSVQLFFLKNKPIIYGRMNLGAKNEFNSANSLNKLKIIILECIEIGRKNNQRYSKTKVNIKNKKLSIIYFENSFLIKYLKYY